MRQSENIIYIIIDDPIVREKLETWVRSGNVEVHTEDIRAYSDDSDDKIQELKTAKIILIGAIRPETSSKADIMTLIRRICQWEQDEPSVLYLQTDTKLPDKELVSILERNVRLHIVTWPAYITEDEEGKYKEYLLAKLNEQFGESEGPEELEVGSIIGRISDEELVFVAVDPRTQEVRDQALRYALNRNRDILLVGETGVGKEVIARFIHNVTHPDESKAFMAVNCSAIPNDLIEEEFFGHEPYVFTGAGPGTKGKFEAVGEGTLFLDEIGDLSFEAQTRLLRVLQEREFDRIGGHVKRAGRTEPPVEFRGRVVAATNKDLIQEVESGSFRADLYYRVSFATIYVPPLHERPLDIRYLIDYLLQLRSQQDKMPEVKAITKDAIDLLLTHDYPGNVRELERILLKAAFSAERRDRVIRCEDIQLGGSLRYPYEAHRYGAYAIVKIKSDGEEKYLLQYSPSWKRFNFIGTRRAGSEMPMETAERGVKKELGLGYGENYHLIALGQVHLSQRSRSANRWRDYTINLFLVRFLDQVSEKYLRGLSSGNVFVTREDIFSLAKVKCQCNSDNSVVEIEARISETVEATLRKLAELYGVGYGDVFERIPFSNLTCEEN